MSIVPPKTPVCPPSPSLAGSDVVCETAYATLGERYYSYHRVGHDMRDLELRSDGTIGEGAGDAERHWFVRQSASRRTLCIGSHTELTCELHQGANGVWEGRWQKYERMPIRLMPHRAHVLIDLLGAPQHPLLGAEVGIFEGHTSKLLLTSLPGLWLWMIDRWIAPVPGDQFWRDTSFRHVTKPQMDAALLRARDDTQFAEHRRLMLIGDQGRAARCVPAGSLDFVFLDADHTEEGTLEAIDTWWPKVRRGGLMAGHDFDYPKFPGVRLAVEETSRRRDLTWHSAPDYFWYFRLPE